jgi:hypothetical protein
MLHPRAALVSGLLSLRLCRARRLDLRNCVHCFKTYTEADRVHGTSMADSSF